MLESEGKAGTQDADASVEVNSLQLDNEAITPEMVQEGVSA
jgi:hypothetical protein